MRKAAIGLLILALLLFAYLSRNAFIISPVQKNNKPVEKPLDKYTFERLRQKIIEPSEITIGNVVLEDKTITSYMFYFLTDGKKVSGLIHIPKREGTYPIIVQFRGFVPKEKYTTGEGTKHSGELFARNGFITLAPDFLGYGQSASPSANSIEERFETYTTGVSLLASLESLNKTLGSQSVAQADTQKIGIWGHSNGGHIALSVVEIIEKPYPTVLWNPVTKPFPYSILYFTDDFDDHGKALRRAVAQFEKDYDAELYSSSNFYNWITAPILLQQAVDDEAVPLRWSDQFYSEMKKLGKDIEYFTYPGENHNFSKGSWSGIVQKDIAFFQSQFAK